MSSQKAAIGPNNVNRMLINENQTADSAVSYHSHVSDNKDNDKGNP